MEKMFNGILMILFLVVFYFCLQKYKKENREDFNTEKLFSDVSTKLSQDTQFQKSYNFKPMEDKKVRFEYGETDITKQFLKEQEKGAVMNTNYPYTWIENNDKNGNPIYNSYANMTGNTDTFIDSKARLSHDFNKLKVTNMDAPISPSDDHKTIKDIYDNSFVDYKKLIPQKKVIDSKPNNTFLEAASNLSFITPDVWVYGNEKPENGGKIDDGFYASDPTVLGSSALYN